MLLTVRSRGYLSEKVSNFAVASLDGWEEALSPQVAALEF